MENKLWENWKEKEELTEEEEAGEGASEGGVDEAAKREIKTGIPFGVQVVLLRNRAISVVLCH